MTKFEVKQCPIYGECDCYCTPAQCCDVKKAILCSYAKAPNILKIMNVKVIESKRFSIA